MTIIASTCNGSAGMTRDRKLFLSNWQLDVAVFDLAENTNIMDSNHSYLTVQTGGQNKLWIKQTEML